jgi:hypothetical protein
MSSDRPQRPNVVRRERPARETTPISAPALKDLVEGSRPPVVDPNDAPFEVTDDDDDMEMSVTEDDPNEPRPKFAHVVRRPPAKPSGG